MEMDMIWYDTLFTVCTSTKLKCSSDRCNFENFFSWENVFNIDANVFEEAALSKCFAG